MINETSRYYDISIFNERFLDKHEVFDILADHEAVKQYLPESELLTSYEQLEKFINEHRVAYVKPIQGSLGRGIIRITAQPNSTYSLERAVTTTQKASNFTSLKRLYLALKPQLAKRKYQIQQGLSLIQQGRRPVDFRALVQKNGQGQWSITSVVARTAGNDNFVANLARGGSIDSVLNTLPHTNLDKHISYDTIKHSLKAIALTIANALDERVDGHFAEFGVDLAVDVQGDIWLIEVNSKPSKVNRSSLSKKYDHLCVCWLPMRIIYQASGKGDILMEKLNLGVIVAKIDVQNQVEGVHIVMPEPIFIRNWLARQLSIK